MRRAAGALALPRRAGAETEPEWKLYEEGDPHLYDHWKGKAPNALSENADINPSDDLAMAPDRDNWISPRAAFLQLCTAFAILGGFFFLCNTFAPEPDLIPRNDWRTLPFQEGGPHAHRRRRQQQEAASEEEADE